MLKELGKRPEPDVGRLMCRSSDGCGIYDLADAGTIGLRLLSRCSRKWTSSGRQRHCEEDRLDSSVSIPEVIMSAELSPIVSEFATEEQAASYNQWLRAKVQASLDDPRPSIPHDQVMADMRALIESKRNKHDAG
jgi:hypothetical protein